MQIALVISVAAAVLFLVLYVDRRDNIKVFKAHIDDQKKVIDQLSAERDRLSQAAEATPSADSQYLRKTTPELVCEALRFNGYTPTLEDGFIMFMIQGERYFIRETDRLPYFMLDKPYTLDPKNYDMPLFLEAARKTTDSILMGKVIITNDQETLDFQVDSFEPQYGHLRDSIGCYLGIISDMQRRLHEQYEELLKQKDSQESLTAMTLQQGEIQSGEKKLMS